MLRTILLAAGFAGAATIAQAAQLFFDDFNSNSTGLDRTPSGWTVSNGTVDIVGPTLYGTVCAINETCIDLDGSSNNAGRMATASTFQLMSNQSYRLTFDYTWNYFAPLNNSMTFGVGGFTQTLSTPPVASHLSIEYATYQSYEFTFTGNGTSGNIFFDHAGGDNGGIVIDNVRFEGELTSTTTGGSTTSPIPVPAGLPLVVSALGAFAALRRFRKG